MHQRVSPYTKSLFPSSIYTNSTNLHFRTQTLLPPIEPNMSLPTPPEHRQLRETSATSSSSCRNTTPPPLPCISGKVEESDEDLFTVPDVEARKPVVLNNNNANVNNNSEVQPDQKRRRGRNPVDKEYRRLKRLLRNRVSAQQARERKKLYVNELESRAKELQDNNSKLEEKISTLVNENAMLRKVLMNTRPKADQSIEQQQDQFAKS